MRVKQKCIGFTLLLSLAFSSVVYGAGINMETKQVTVSGKFENAICGTRYLAKVFSPNGKINLTTKPGTSYCYLHQDVLAENGDYGFSFFLPDLAKDGHYIVEIIPEKSEMQTDEFYYYTQQYADGVVGQLMNPQSDEQTDPVILLYDELEKSDIRICLDTDFTNYDAVSDKKAVVRELMKLKNINSRSAFQKAFAGISAAFRIREVHATDVPGVLERAAEVMALTDKSTYREYVASERQNAISEFLMTSGCVNGEELAERLSYHVISYALEHMGNWQRCRTVLLSYQDILNLDFAQFDASSSQYDIVERFLSTDCTSVSSIVTAFYQAVSSGTASNEEKIIPTSVSRGTGSSGGSGSSYHSSIVENNIEAAPLPAKGFPDIANDYWAAKEIERMKEKGVICGDEAGLFRPDQSISREEFVKLMVLSMELSAVGEYEGFPDVPQESWSSPYIRIAHEQRLVGGNDDGNFMPQENISRQDLFTILGRWLTKGDTIRTQTINFSDDEAVADYALPYIAYLSEKGLLSGYEDNTLRPLASCTRAEAAVMLCRITDALKAEGGAK